MIDSSPRGADVYKQPLGLRVGPTPYRVKQTAAEGELVYVLKKPGYRTKEIVLQADRSTKIRVELERRTSGTTTAGDTTAAGSGTDRKPVATDSGADKKPVADDDGAGKKPVTSDDGAGKKPVASDDGAGKKPVVSGEGPGKDQETTTDSARESSVTGRSLNPFEKKPKKPKQGKGRSLNPFEK